MKTGRTLTELAAEIERQRETRRDYIAPTQALEYGLYGDNNDVRLVGLGENDSAPRINALAHRQIGDYAGVPAKYYDRMRDEAPALLATNINHWFAKAAEPRMVRVLDSNVRAFLSDRYRPLENVDLCEATLPALADLGVDILSCEITERRLYLKVVDRKINREVAFGEGHRHFKDVLCPAMVISNSEVGSGALAVDTAVWTEGCTNLAIIKARSMRKYHVGGKHELVDDFTTMLSDETRTLTDQAVWAQVRDVVKGAFERARFDAEVDKIAGMAEQKIEADVVKAVQVAARTFDIGEGERKSVLKHLIAGGDLSRYGLFNAITRTAEDVADYDRATDLERVGGALIELPANDWRVIAQAA